MKNLTAMAIDEFVKYLHENDISKFYFVFDDETSKMISSHEALQQIADALNSDSRDMDRHEGLFYELYDKYDVILGAVVHRTNRGQAAGGVRFWQYDTVEDYIRDGLRLSKGMTHKNALAGLWWGGGKGVIAHNPKFDKYDETVRKDIYTEYGKFMTSLEGCYVTAEDVGTNVDDMANIFSRTRFTTCIPKNLGGSGNPSIPTARGVLSGIEAALEYSGSGEIEGKTFAVQGLGNVARPLIQFLFDKNAGRIIAADINPANAGKAKAMFADLNFEARIVDNSDMSILYEDCDVLCPCATGAILNPNTIPNIKAKIICGAANNQLEDQTRDDIALLEKGILYVPDFLNNRMGIVNCANEQYGYVENDPLIFRHFSRDWNHSIFNTAISVFEKAEKNNRPTGEIALKMAEELSLVDHPVFGHRSKLIINSLVKKEWHRN